MNAAPEPAEAGAACLVQRLLGAAQQKSANLALHLHPGWLAAAVPDGGADGALSAGTPQVATRASLLLGQAYGVRWPTVVSLRERLHRIALLTREPLLQVLGAAALFGRSADVRRCVGRPARSALIALIGEPAYAALLRTPDAGGASRPIELAELQAGDCVVQGYQLLQASARWACRDAALITRLSLPPDALGAALAAGGGTGAMVQVSGLFDRFDAFFPEQAWMFGSDMDRALSG